MSDPLAWVDLGETPYRGSLELMRRWVRERQDGLVGDRLFLLSHPPVITYGPRTPRGDLPAESSALSVVEVDRGGQATYHGPGQLIGYLIMNVRGGGPADVVRWLENGLIEALGALGFSAKRRDTPRGSPSLVGVWTEDHCKIASIGMRIRGGVTSHGFALNVSPDLAAFAGFVPCGLDDVTMTSLAHLAEERGAEAPTDATVRAAVAEALGAVRAAAA
ncbi:lipoyl(octanoyl) transferase LipB [Solihabitans fulvus]|uniref:Octanoyltransferase n=1 Tax=Solihabitans fulvus TaxID=1892852 RepID=A0A5B2WGC4_9PSEU|nr:lipoyl(octanoyl) transferase LipB [Solihabitans fulvus]KAA2250164.1 lipoyl(octanoyl) transferase LipB [Solihabitans fulvus]